MLLLSLLLSAVSLRVAARPDTLSVRASHPKPPCPSDNYYNITLFHVNDVHAHLDEFVASGTDCTDPAKGCFGGYARIKKFIDDERPKKNHSLFLNIGDEWQGTLFFTFYGGTKIAETINQLGFDAMTLGNHEWDRGDDELGTFLKSITVPVVSANVHSTQPDLNATIKPYTIFEQHKLAVIGVTTETTPDISSPGEGTTFSDPITALQNTINLIKRRRRDVTRFIAITHVGYEVDIQIAKQVRGLHLIIGGHSHTLLGDMAGAEGPYPTIAQNPDGEDVFIVTSYRWGEYLGEIEVSFDPKGKIVAYTGAPIRLTNATGQDAALQAQVKEWRAPFAAFAAEVVGSTTVELGQSTCKVSDCLLGQVMADSIVHYRRGEVEGALFNGGGVRTRIDVGDITRGEIITAFPFGNLVADVHLTGQELWDTFEGVFSKVSVFNGRPVVAGLQVSSEFTIKYNLSNPAGTRLVSVSLAGVPLDLARTYHIGSTDFAAKGGDNILPVQDPASIITLDTMDEVLLEYVNATSPISRLLEARMTDLA